MTMSGCQPHAEYNKLQDESVLANYDILLLRSSVRLYYILCTLLVPVIAMSAHPLVAGQEDPRRSFHSSLVPGHPHSSIQLQEIFSLANMSLTFGPSVITNEVIAKLGLEKITVISTFASKGMCKIPKALLS